MSIAADSHALAVIRRREMGKEEASIKRLNKVLLRVQRAANRGEFECEAPLFIFHPLNDADLCALRGLGYTVWVGPVSGTVRIEWKNA